tara:strand:+ start:1630 stop:1983 length:354 start_codon:yes stop_codon:yes gene_type:complete
MAQIPGSTIFASAAQQYGKNMARTEAFTLPRLTTSSYFKPGNARTIDVVAKGAVDVIVQSGQTGPFAAPPRKLNLSGGFSAPGGTNTGIISGSIVPHEFAIKDTSNGSNPVTLYFNY